ncbi:MAG TPA: hypothetical protein VG498_00595 [Terriglobales bacterium]|nr:hypothetical protein [Terriglobales bacterium]
MRLATEFSARDQLTLRPEAIEVNTATQYVVDIREVAQHIALAALQTRTNLNM